MALDPFKLEETLRAVADPAARVAMARAVAPDVAAVADAARTGDWDESAKLLAGLEPRNDGAVFTLLDAETSYEFAGRHPGSELLDAVRRTHPVCGTVQLEALATEPYYCVLSALRRQPELLPAALVAALDWRDEQSGAVLQAWCTAPAELANSCSQEAYQLFAVMMCEPDGAYPTPWYDVPQSWWQRLSPLGAATVGGLWNAELGSDEIAALLVGCTFTDEAVAELATLAGEGPPEADQLVLADRAGFVSLPVEPSHEAAAAALVLVQGAELRAELLAGVLESPRAVVHSLEWARELAATGLGPLELSYLVSAELLPEVLLGPDAGSPDGDGPDDEVLTAVLDRLDVLGVQRLLSTVPGDSPVRERITALAPTRIPGLLQAFAQGGCYQYLSDAVAEYLGEELGDGELTWSQLYQLAPRWPGTVEAAVTTVRASQR